MYQPAAQAQTAVREVGAQVVGGTARGFQRRRGSISEIDYAHVSQRRSCLIAVGRSRQDLADLTLGVDNLFHQRGVPGASTVLRCANCSITMALTVIGHVAHNQFRHLYPPTLYLDFLRSYNGNGRVVETARKPPSLSQRDSINLAKPL